MSRLGVRPHRAAIEYNVARTAHHSDVRGLAGAGADLALKKSVEPLSASAQRVLAVVTGFWVEQEARDCLPNRGKHSADCAHRANRVEVSLSLVSRRTFGLAGGSQIRQVSDALDEMSAETIEYTTIDVRGYVRRRHHILSFRETGDLAGTMGMGRATLQVAFDPLLLESLLAGHYQFIPIELVRGLKGEIAFRLWMQVLVQPGVAKLRQPGDYREFAVSGRDPTISLALVGLGGQRPGRAFDSLQSYAERGNGLQDTYKLEVLDRNGGVGHKLRLTLLRNPSAREQGAPRQPRPAGTADQVHSYGKPDPEPRQPGAPNDLGRGRVDGFESVIKTQVSDSDAGGIPGRPDVVLLTRCWRRAPTDRQVKRILDPIAKRHGGPGAGWDWNAWQMSEAIRLHTDPISYLKLQDDGERGASGHDRPRTTSKPRSDDQRPRPRSRGLDPIKTTVEAMEWRTR